MLREVLLFGDSEDKVYEAVRKALVGVEVRVFVNSTNNPQRFKATFEYNLTRIGSERVEEIIDTAIVIYNKQKKEKEDEGEK